jgi:hypothetical protein
LRTWQGRPLFRSQPQDARAPLTGARLAALSRIAFALIAMVIGEAANKIVQFSITIFELTN